ncbi:ABC transporter [Actinopolyspora mzabensis]|uniref:ABC transporter n=1 Tax=Actinopolyspora mzabensis TaxID=995066 RepID=A0A1G9CF91_ACTMZ|nr:ATP-binding cassette domain-containing protein [Actinopolyspora mzabensis]SDK50134.1 ABC transporter [Actinopolyspora mzabensis]
MSTEGVAITARGISVRGPLGPVFSNVDVEIRPGELATVTGPSGTGRTALLLTLSGRLHPITGAIEVDGRPLPKGAKRARTLIAPARLRPGFELEGRWRVREAVRERRITTKVDNDDISDAFDLVGIDPEPEALIDSLHPGERLLLAVALGMAALPAGLLVDDVELGLPEAARTRVWAALETVARTGTTVVASNTDPPRFEAGPVIRLPGPNGETPHRAGGTAPETTLLPGQEPNTVEFDTETTRILGADAVTEPHTFDTAALSRDPAQLALFEAPEPTAPPEPDPSHPDPSRPETAESESTDSDAMDSDTPEASPEAEPTDSDSEDDGDPR